ncbi:MAG: hypothetical protein QOE93_560 [Actinomycetota bacterium]|nr:hypothetical protein [Actinomycetota bacterium]
MSPIQPVDPEEQAPSDELEVLVAPGLAPDEAAAAASQPPADAEAGPSPTRSPAAAPAPATTAIPTRVPANSIADRAADLATEPTHGPRTAASAPETTTVTGIATPPTTLAPVRQPRPRLTDQIRTWARDFRFDRYVILCLVVFALMFSFVIKGAWAGGVDIWEHSASVREFAAHPFNPSHPLLGGLDAPHQFLNPYAWGVGVFSRISTLDVVTAMNLAGFFNLILLMVGFRLFVRKVTGREGVDFWAFLFVLTLWGPAAWFFSGFLHFNVLAIVLTYPATFAKGVVFLALCGHLAFLRRNDPRWLIAVGLAGSVVLVCHPVDALFLWLGMVALTATTPTPAGARRDRTIAFTLVAIGGSFVVALLWPHFSLFDLLFGDSTKPYREAIGGADRDMYHRPLTRLFPALVMLPFAAYRMRHWRNDPLVIMFVGCLVGYGYGYAIGNYSFGRLISNATMIGAIILAEEVVKTVQAADMLGPAGQPAKNFAVFMSISLVVVGLYSVRNGFEVLPDRFVKDRSYELIHNEVDLVPIKSFDFLVANADIYPMAISDLYTSMELPTFGPKVLAYARFQAFVNMDERGNDYRRFYDPSSTTDVRREIIRKYGITLIVLTTQSIASDAVSQALATLGPTVSVNDRFAFIDVRDVLGAPGQLTPPR